MTASDIDKDIFSLGIRAEIDLRQNTDKTMEPKTQNQVSDANSDTYFPQVFKLADLGLR